MKERVAEGRWQLIGGAWVEPDCNAIGSESLARQFLLGRNYFRRHFGDVETPVLWLPDTFGYSWALPQLIEQAGKKYFITHKMSWNQYNHMPDPVADQGWHNMVYSLLPHTGDWRGEVVQQAYDLNNPVIMTKTGFWNDPAGHPYQHSLVSVDKPNVIIETVKQAEYGEGIILRLYEHHRKRGRVALRAGFHLATAYECNLLE